MGPSGLHRNSPEGLNISSVRFLTRSEIQKSLSPFAPLFTYVINKINIIIIIITITIIIKVSPIQAKKAHEGCGREDPYMHCPALGRGRVASPTLGRFYT